MLKPSIQRDVVRFFIKDSWSQIIECYYIKKSLRTHALDPGGAGILNPLQQFFPKCDARLDFIHKCGQNRSQTGNSCISASRLAAPAANLCYQRHLAAHPVAYSGNMYMSLPSRRSVPFYCGRQKILAPLPCLHCN